jgi:glycosyltransferase 2 family protein
LNLKSVLRWLVRLLTFGFLAHALVKHWRDVAALTLLPGGVAYLALGALVTLSAHVWAGVAWNWLLRACGHERETRWAIVVYLRTNVAKYLPGNVWHFYRRVRAAQERDIPLGAALLSVVLEAVLMVAAGSLLASLSFLSLLHSLPAVALLAAIHPRFLNPVLARLAKAKAKTFGRLAKGAAEAAPPVAARLDHYPLLPLAGEVVFACLRGGGFLLCVLSLYQPSWEQLPLIFAAFCIAWIAGLVVPGAPGGIGVFEATALGLLHGQVPPAIVFGFVAAYRLISTGTEALGGLVPERWSNVGAPARAQ